VDYEYAVEPARAFRFLGCAACSCEWLDPRPDGAELSSFYPAGYHAYNDDHGWLATLLVSIRGRLRARQYRAMLPPEGGRIFDVGAGDCRHFRELARNPGIAFAGVEIHPGLAARAREQGYDVEAGTLEEMDLARHEGRYHVVSMNHVLEHVLDPVEVLRRVGRLLVPGGHVVGQIPTLSSWERRRFGSYWAAYHFPRHTQIFTRPGLAGLLEVSGFRDVKIRATPHVQTALSLQNWLVARGAAGRLRFGRTRFFGLFLMLSLPLELGAFLLDRSGVVDFEARRPPPGPDSEKP